ncbi:succinoglycan biosynthesis protein exoa (plasmid) [Gemmobacter aquarius]|uniref:Succinoglycan biosynthesis protein exoa n=1 Tax=Paragemmobacter aquarius TaxID=2169400 RepID=A0A2S0US53_9RHOB|nr:glycosyltransferase family 2 protein [Gemmobacter aquarius]AWB50635.1 succinoglycan biosynthesis protein exoa [Gemmobacter aquarius]
MMDRLLIVIPTLNEEAHIAAVLQSLVAEAPADAKVVVSDGGSIDNTRCIVAGFPRVTLLNNPQKLQGAGINRAVETLGQDCTVLLRADAHATYPAGFIQALLDELHATEADSVTVPMRTLGPTPFTEAVAAAQNSVLGTGGSAHRTGKGGRFVDHGHHALMRLSAFRSVGGYDPAQSHNEDAELDYRLRAAGHTIWLTDKTCIGYVPRSTFSALFHQYFKHGKGRATTAQKHNMRLKLRQIAPLLVLSSLVLAAIGLGLSLIDPMWMMLTIPTAAWAVVCLILGAALAIKARRLPMLLSGPAAMVMHIGWGLGFLTAARQ